LIALLIPSEAALVTPVVIAARICGHHVLTCGSESRTVTKPLTGCEADHTQAGRTYHQTLTCNL
jgi:hypothetical protein